MKTIKIEVPAALTLTAVSLFDLWKGNITDSVAGLDEWLGEKTEVEIADLAVLEADTLSVQLPDPTRASAADSRFYGDVVGFGGGLARVRNCA